MPTDVESIVLPAVTESRAKPLPLHLPIFGSAPALVPARMINEVLYCERLLYLEWVQKEFVDNAFTVEGRAAHKRADQPGGKLPAPPNATTDTTGGPSAAMGAAEISVIAEPVASEPL